MLGPLHRLKPPHRIPRRWVWRRQLTPASCTLPRPLSCQVAHRALLSAPTAARLMTPLCAAGQKAASILIRQLGGRYCWNPLMTVMGLMQWRHMPSCVCVCVWWWSADTESECFVFFPSESGSHFLFAACHLHLLWLSGRCGCVLLEFQFKKLASDGLMK